jgi:hypothetical protein
MLLNELVDVTDWAAISFAISVDNDTNVNPRPSAAAIRIVEGPVFSAERQSSAAGPAAKASYLENL